jgi:hypothetical protein
MYVIVNNEMLAPQSGVREEVQDTRQLILITAGGLVALGLVILLVRRSLAYCRKR